MGIKIGKNHQIGFDGIPLSIVLIGLAVVGFALYLIVNSDFTKVEEVILCLISGISVRKAMEYISFNR